MRSLLVISGLFILMSCTMHDMSSKNLPSDGGKDSVSQKKPEVVKTDEEWKRILTPEQYYVLREKGTERPFSGKFELHKEKGMYVCAACGNELFSSDTKFDSGCGWPSFFASLDSTRIRYKTDETHGMTRTEITCARCGGHLGHVFDDGPAPTGLRYCVNSVSLDFKKGSSDSSEKK
jgi:peptide-methionine (R)-S-oxide reductase